MLILGRKKGQQIKIGNDITIVYLGSTQPYKGQAKIGVIAPPNVSVHRQEIYEKIQEQEEKA
jgi:carbon storage regulator